MLLASGKAPIHLDTGKEIYRAACVTCHGVDGKGAPQHLTQFKRPLSFPDFSDCRTSSPENDLQWRSVITNGGPARGFSTIMPAFGDELTEDQITKLVEYLRSLCGNPSWPIGNFNLPRPLITEKAFPEDEVVIAGSANLHGAPSGSATVYYEKRIGSSGQIEAAVPYNVAHDNGVTHAGFGDLSIGYKQKLIASTKTGSILSIAGEIVAPTGNQRFGLGGGSTVFEPFLAFGQMLPSYSFVQIQTGYELSARPDALPRAYYFHSAVGKTFRTGNGLGRWWTPMTEFIVDRDFETGAMTNWSVVPQIQIPISKRMHILANIGVSIPANNSPTQSKQVMVYFLWDYVDGTLRQGWR